VTAVALTLVYTTIQTSASPEEAVVAQTCCYCE
jgi:hypothetical protein